jgi:hypothetical protein
MLPLGEFLLAYICINLVCKCFSSVLTIEITIKMFKTESTHKKKMKKKNRCENRCYKVADHTLIE